MTMNQKDEDFICFYRDAVIAGHDDPAAKTMRQFNLSRDYTIRLLNEAIAQCDGQDIRNWSRRMRATVMNKSESLKRAAECTRLAEAASDPDMQAYLLKLGLSWMRVAAEPDQRPPEEDRRLKTLQDLVG